MSVRQIGVGNIGREVTLALKHFDPEGRYQRRLTGTVLILSKVDPINTQYSLIDQKKPALVNILFV